MNNLPRMYVRVQKVMGSNSMAGRVRIMALDKGTQADPNPLAYFMCMFFLCRKDACIICGQSQTPSVIAYLQGA